MKFLIVTHTPHYVHGDQILAYGPYVREMNLWLKYVDSVEVVTPIQKEAPGAIHQPYQFDRIRLRHIPAISLTSWSNAFRSLLWSPWILIQLMRAMSRADHIHLRCPGSIGLLGCLAQIFFPRKTKTAKYAGNWDPKAVQPRSYRFQKWLLANTFLTRNMQVLVYGDWPGQSKNIKPFFTATYSKQKVQVSLLKRENPPFRFLFVGSLSPGKRPIYAAQLVARLVALGYDCRLDIYGEGPERIPLEAFQRDQSDSSWLTLHGNQDAALVEVAYRQSDFLILASKSEGWPKVVAEAMFWGTIPAASGVSCLSWMLGEGSRGLLLSLLEEDDITGIEAIMKDKDQRIAMRNEASQWSRQYTLDRFEEELKSLM